jgi:hypothetical protein
MASQANKTQDSNAPTPSEKLQEEVEPTARLDLLVPAGKVTNSNRLRFIARLSPLMDALDGLTDDEDEDDNSLLGMPPETMEAMADFTEFVSENFTESEQAAVELESLDFEIFIKTVFTYLEQLGELIGSSS